MKRVKTTLAARTAVGNRKRTNVRSEFKNGG